LVSWKFAQVGDPDYISNLIKPIPPKKEESSCDGKPQDGDDN
jgi:hypothetical protein